MTMGSPANLRIGYVLKRFPNLSQTFILNEMLELERQGVHVEVISLRPPRTEPTHASLSLLKAQVTYIQEDSTASAAEQVANWAKTKHLQHLHAHFATSAAATAMQAAELAYLAYSFTAHARDIFHQNTDHQALAERIANARFVVTVSDYNKEYLNQLLAKQGYSGNVIRLYNGLDLTSFKPSENNTQPGHIVSIGRLVPKKGMIYLLEACAILRDRNIPFRTEIIGDGEERPMLESAIQNHHLTGKVVLVGALNQSAVLDKLSRAELFALPCIVADDGDVDGLPTVILEAMALGIPMVSTRLVGIPEMIVHGYNGLLVGQRQTEELADALETLLKSNELRSKYREQSLHRAAQLFDIKKNVAQLIALFSKASQHQQPKECC